MHTRSICACLCLMLAIAHAADTSERLGLLPVRARGEKSKPEFESEWAVHLEGISPNSLEELGYEVLGQVSNLENIYLVRHKETHARHEAASEMKMVGSPDVTAKLLAIPNVKWAEQQFRIQRHTRAVTDPLFTSQWHLVNTGQFSGLAGVDVNIQGAWDQGITGTGVRIAVVDDGFQTTHPDLAPAYKVDSSYSFNAPVGNAPDPNVNSDFHGTAAAGVAMAASNAVCGVGAAYTADGAGIRLIAGPASDANEANGLTYKNQLNDIYSNSWGPADDAINVDKPGPLTAAAMKNSVVTGRGGKGSIYVWAAGNGGDVKDNCNYDGYANSRVVIAVGALGNDGKQSFYSEPCAALIVTAPSSSANPNAGIRTTDLVGANGYTTDSCTPSFGGTSSACPLVAGIVALILQSNPNLGWRDVQLVLAKTAAVVDANDADWTTNGFGFHINHKYGFGVVDATAAVNAAKSHNLLSEEIVVSTAVVPVGQAIPDAPSAGISSTVNIDDDIVVEKVFVTVTINHPASGDLKIVVTSPAGTQSILSTPHSDVATAIIAGTITEVGAASFGPPISFNGVAGTIVASAPVDACTTITNCAALAGTIAYVRAQGTCGNDFSIRAKLVQGCGAKAMLVWDSIAADAGSLFTLGGTNDPSITIPSAFMSYTDAVQLAPVAKAGQVKSSQYPANNYAAGWAMSTARSMGESSRGTWKVQVSDGFLGQTGTFTSFKIDVYGSKSSPGSFASTAVSHRACAALVALMAILPLLF